MKTPKLYKIESTRRGNTYSMVGTLAHLIQAHRHTLEVGASWAHESGNKKINQNPKSAATLVKNLYNAKNNAAADGWSGCTFELGEVSAEEKAKYFAENPIEEAV